MSYRGNSRWRFIPVLTGNTVSHFARLSDDPVYPRTHGEHGSKSLTVRPDCGLSPYSRGTRIDSDFFITPCRFIPVLTGNTRIDGNRRITPPVYPRTHGEHITLFQFSAIRGGLSPYSRGTPVCNYSVPCEFRFIPVLTGNTSSAAKSATP